MESHTPLSKQLSHLLTEAVTNKVFPGAVVGVITKEGRVIVPVGHHTFEQKASPMRDDSLFDVASITKTVPTSLLAIKLIEEKKLSLRQKIHTLLPQFQGRWKEDVTVFHLLTQTVDFGLTLSQLKHLSPDDILRVILTCDLRKNPGTSYSYTNSTSIVLGLVIEKATGKSLSQLAKEKLFTPLQMFESAFDASQFPKDRIVPTEIDLWRNRIIQGEIHDESAFVLSQKRYVGSAGIFSTAADLLNVLEMMIRSGTFRGNRVFTSQTISQMQTNQLSLIGEYAGLGWEIHQSYMGKHALHMIGKTGFTGCMMVYDSKHEIGTVLLSNYHFPKRKENSRSLNTVRKDIIETTLQTLSI